MQGAFSHHPAAHVNSPPPPPSSPSVSSGSGMGRDGICSRHRDLNRLASHLTHVFSDTLTYLLASPTI